MASLLKAAACVCGRAAFRRSEASCFFGTKIQPLDLRPKTNRHHLHHHHHRHHSAKLRLHRATQRRMSSSAESMNQRMVWVDLEMTGLDIEKDEIIEMACIVTDSDLNVVEEGPNLIINQPDKLLDGMSDWCKEHHGKSGLTQAVRDSKISLQQAEYEFLSFVRRHTPPGQCPLAGNSVHADKKFLDKFMPQFMRHLHYRIIDVSTVKELCRRWFPEELRAAPQKKAQHRALDDIRESMKELKYYRESVFKPGRGEKKRKIVENGNTKCKA